MISARRTAVIAGLLGRRDIRMRISLIAAAALSLVAQAGSTCPAAQPQNEQRGYQAAWVDHTRAAEAGDYNT